ncbi:DNA-directed RNA polymerase II subunit RPB11 [Dendrobium catenatum]|uniref:DNA-directed RNA polymerase II subunit RPB11 n=1 Tax=Dendrobium catenatum TaxID=906689 RepID=A0A2I0WSN9_9ASPA|nr:DNA-directed RNA polymerase II subunit RPB11 [Dendrobium catenatum]
MKVIDEPSHNPDANDLNLMKSKDNSKLNIDPRVEFCGYSIPHPSENKVNIRVQTTGDSAKDVLKESFQDLILLCQHVRSTFEKSVADFKSTQSHQEMNGA